MYWVHAQMVVLALCASNAHFGASWCMSFIPLLLARPCFNAKASMPRHRHKDDYRYQLKMKSKLLVAREILELDYFQAVLQGRGYKLDICNSHCHISFCPT